MKLTITKKINATTKIDAVIDAEHLDDALLQAGPLLAQDVCGHVINGSTCGSTDIYLEASKPQGKYTYIKRCCKKCGAKDTLGTYEDGSGNFWRNKWEIYTPEK